MEPIASSSTNIKIETADDSQELKPQISEEKPDIQPTPENPEPQFFHCANCLLKEKYDYFGKNPPYTKIYKLSEKAYCIEDPFLPPKQGKFIILGAHCIKCNKSVCKDMNCSFYFAGTYCIQCAKQCSQQFPSTVQDKLNKSVIS